MKMGPRWPNMAFLSLSSQGSPSLQYPPREPNSATSSVLSPPFFPLELRPFDARSVPAAAASQNAPASSFYSFAHAGRKLWLHPPHLSCSVLPFSRDDAKLESGFGGNCPPQRRTFGLGCSFAGAPSTKAPAGAGSVFMIGAALDASSTLLFWDPLAR